MTGKRDEPEDVVLKLQQAALSNSSESEQPHNGSDRVLSAPYWPFSQ